MDLISLKEFIRTTPFGQKKARILIKKYLGVWSIRYGNRYLIDTDKYKKWVEESFENGRPLD